jgi:hypothetical protein
VVNQQIKAPARPGRRRRSRLVTLLALAFGVMSLINLGRAVQSYLNLTLLADWNISFVPWMLIVLSVAWALVFLAAGWALWRRRPWAWRLGRYLPPVYGLFSSGQILLLTRSPYARGRWLLVALGWVTGTLLVYWILSRPRIRAQFRV